MFFKFVYLSTGLSLASSSLQLGVCNVGVGPRGFGLIAYVVHKRHETSLRQKGGL